MKNLNRITKYFITLFWLGLSCSILKAEVVITELFISPADGSPTPQYIELYNNSSFLINLENWSIKTLDNTGAVFPGYPVFYNDGISVEFNDDVEVSNIRSIFESTDFKKLVERIDKKNAFRPYPDINDIPE